MKRTKLSERELPDYTKGEEIINTASHSVFHFFVLLGSVLQFITIYNYVI